MLKRQLFKPAMFYIDASRYSNTEKRTGVENYSFHLINELAREHSAEITLISPRKVDLNVNQIVIPIPRLWTLLRLSWEIWRRKIDNLFVPSHVLPLIVPKNTTITIHDVVFKYSPESYSLGSRLYLDWAAKRAVKRAKNIIVPSQMTRNDLISFYHADVKKIHVVPLGFSTESKTVATEISTPILEKYGLARGNYFLYLGRLETKKNTDTLIKAFVEFAKDNEAMKLVLAGFPGYGGEAILKLIPANLEDRILRPGYISELEKGVLLRNTLCFIFPSRFEGFGIPLLEAMHAQVPVIASDIPTSREIGHEGFLFFNPDSTEELADLMKWISKDEQIRLKCITNHESVLRRYNWNLHASKIYSIITSPEGR